MTAGIERSMPRAISTRASPIDAMQRNAAKGMIARIEVAIRLRGTKIALTTMSTRSASQIARKRGCGCNPSRMPGTEIFMSWDGILRSEGQVGPTAAAYAANLRPLEYLNCERRHPG